MVAGGSEGIRKYGKLYVSEYWPEIISETGKIILLGSQRLSIF
jgi:hypothetical protein